MSRTQEQICQPGANVYAGIDVGKSQLDFFVHPLNVKLQVDNDKQGIRELTR